MFMTVLISRINSWVSWFIFNLQKNKWVCRETTLTGESRFHISTLLGIVAGSLITGSKGLTHWTSETVCECSEIAGSPQVSSTPLIYVTFLPSIISIQHCQFTVSHSYIFERLSSASPCKQVHPHPGGRLTPSSCFGPCCSLGSVCSSPAIDMLFVPVVHISHT